MLFLQPRNITERCASVVRECSEDFSDVASLGSSWPRRQVTQYYFCGVCDARNSNYWEYCLMWPQKVCNSLTTGTLFEALSVQTAGAA
jgi:hypothetical protein